MKKRFMAAAFCATLMTGSAFAQAYLGAGAGASKTDTHETSWKLYGGYQLHPNWGVEVGYTDFDRYRGSNIGAWSLAGTGTLPLSQNWSLLGKVGAAWNRPRFSGASNHTDLLLGVGVGYSFTKNLGLRLEYEDFGKLSDNTSGNDSTGRNLGLSVKYEF